MQNLVKIITGIYRHPLNSRRKLKSLLIFMLWQLRSFFTHVPLVYNLTKNSKIFIYKSEPASSANLYYGLHEYSNMFFLMHYLKKNETFIDVGSNLGTFSILASGETECRSIIIEPIPQNVSLIRKNINLNGFENKIQIHELALGSQNEIGKITSDLRDQNFILSSSKNIVMAKDDYRSKALQVEIKQMDYLFSKENPSVIKIDVEGYESEVIAGAKQTLKKDSLKAIIIELRGIGNQRYKLNENLLERKLKDNNFEKFYYNPFSRQLLSYDFDNISEPIFIRDKNLVEKRLLTAKKISINNLSI